MSRSGGIAGILNVDLAFFEYADHQPDPMTSVVAGVRSFARVHGDANPQISIEPNGDNTSGLIVSKSQLLTPRSRLCYENSPPMFQHRVWTLIIMYFRNAGRLILD